MVHKPHKIREHTFRMNENPTVLLTNPESGPIDDAIPYSELMNEQLGRDGQPVNQPQLMAGQLDPVPAKRSPDAATVGDSSFNSFLSSGCGNGCCRELASHGVSTHHNGATSAWPGGGAGLSGPIAVEVEDRRWQVLRLRLRRMPQRAIAAIVGVDQATVSRDLHWIRQNWHAEYGCPAAVSPAEEIGMAVALYEDVEQSALLEFHSLRGAANDRQFSPAFIARQRMACLRTAMFARQTRVNLLRDLGFLARGDRTSDLPSADCVRKTLRAEGLLVTADEGPPHSTGDVPD